MQSRVVPSLQCAWIWMVSSHQVRKRAEGCFEPLPPGHDSEPCSWSYSSELKYSWSRRNFFRFWASFARSTTVSDWSLRHHCQVLDTVLQNDSDIYLNQSWILIFFKTIFGRYLQEQILLPCSGPQVLYLLSSKVGRGEGSFWFACDLIFKLVHHFLNPSSDKLIHRSYRCSTSIYYFGP